MKAVFDTKEFIELDVEQRLNILDILEKTYSEVCFDEEIKKLEAEKQDLEAKIMQDKEAIQDVTNVVNGLDEAEKRKSQVVLTLEDLKKQAGMFKQKAAELDKHKKALELKTLVLKKNSLAHEIDELKTELENLREQKIESQNSLVEIRANFDNFYESYNSEVARLMFEEKMIESLAADESNNEDVVLESFKNKNALSEIESEILVTKETIERYTSKCQAVEDEIAEKSDLIHDIYIPEESRELIVQAKDLESEIIIYDGMLEKLDNLLDGIKSDIAEAKVLYSAEVAVERKRDEDLEKINNSTAKVFENSELSNFEKLRSCDKSLADIYVVEYEIGLVDKQILKLNRKIEERLQISEDLKNKINETARVCTEKEQFVHECKDVLNERREDRESMLGNNHLSMLVEYTNFGDSCPVCKARVHEKNYINKIDLAGIEKEIEMAANRVCYAEKDKETALLAETMYKTKLEFELAQIEFEREEIKRLEDSKIKIYQRVVDANSQMIENFGNIKNALKKTSVALEDLINLQYDLRESVQTSVSKKTEYGSRISLLSEKHEQLLDVYFELQKERAERELMMLEAKSNVSENDFEEKRTLFAENQTLRENVSTEIIELYMQLSELKTNILACQEKLAELEYKRGKIENLSHGAMGGVENQTSTYSIDEIQDKMEDLKNSYKHLLSLKNDAEMSMQNIIREYELKTKLLAIKIDEMQDIGALVSSLVYRYGFSDENEAREYITTDNMIKLKENEIKSYNNRVAKLEAEYSIFAENDNMSVNNVYENVNNLQKEIENNLKRVGEIDSQIEFLQEKLSEYNQIKELIKKYK